MRLAILNSNLVQISSTTKKGSEIFDYILITNLAKVAKKHNITITAFASGNSRLPVKIESVNYYSSGEDKQITNQGHTIFELALISKAFSQQEKFDLYHVNYGNGEVIFPFARFVKKPILVTMHGSLDEIYSQKYFALFKDLKNIFFVSISNSQRKAMPNLNYVETIYHGIDTKKNFQFNPVGDSYLLWTGRAIPEKGLDIVLQVIRKTKKKAKIFPILKEEYFQWLREVIIKRRNIINQAVSIYTDFDIHRYDLVSQYQHSKLFLSPILFEEPFGLTLIESMACGTPVVAYARGSVPEIIRDGVTGFIVNPSDDDIRGDWIIKKTGIEGLCEAVERLYAMPENQYREMRLNCRSHVEQNFTVEKMISEYEKVYQKVLERYKK